MGRGSGRKEENQTVVFQTDEWSRGFNVQPRQEVGEGAKLRDRDGGRKRKIS